MANQYTLDNDFAAISETQGTLYNVGDSAIELADADTTPKGQGILLMTGERRTFNGTLYARSMDAAATLNVSDFTEAARGGDDSIYTFKGSVATYADLPASPAVGDVYDIQAADEAHGILAGDNVAWNGTAWDRLAGIYSVMTGATASTAGKAGLVPAPAAGDDGNLLFGNGTWQKASGYRKPSASCVVGQKAQHETLDASDRILVCTQAGTTGSASLSIPTVALGTEIADGTAKWTICGKPLVRNIEITAPLEATSYEEIIEYGLSTVAPKTWPIGVYIGAFRSYKAEDDTSTLNKQVSGWYSLNVILNTNYGTTGLVYLQNKLFILMKCNTEDPSGWIVREASIPPTTENHNIIFRGNEISDSWATIRANVQAGNFANYYIGDWKEITLTTGEKVVMEIAGLATYTKSGSTELGGCIDFISRDCLSGGRRMNASNNNNGTADEKHPWRASELFQTLNDETNGIYASLPSDLKAVIIEKRAYLEERYSSGGAVSADTEWSDASLGKLWLPSEIEVYGHPAWSEPGYGTAGCGVNIQYPIFKGGMKHIIKGNGNGGYRCIWWELSAHRKNATSFCYVGGSGVAGGANASLTGICVPLCFRIG